MDAFRNEKQSMVIGSQKVPFYLVAMIQFDTTIYHSFYQSMKNMGFIFFYK